MSNAKPKCFVIMPFGERADAEGKIVDFNEVYTCVIKPTIESLDIDCVRCDEIEESGRIHRKMFEHVYEDDVAVVDITQLNPNVFYELGIRHALVAHTTVLIKQANTQTPFNVGGLNIIEYDYPNHISIEEAKRKIISQLKNGLKNQRPDSPVQDVLRLKISRPPKDILTTRWCDYQIEGVAGKTVGIVTGDLKKVKGIDVWVSSENTDMEMARHFDRSISSVIRYYGAKRDKAGVVVQDLISDDLAEVVQTSRVPPGLVVSTTAGELERRNGVKRIFHAAAVQGQIGRGYTPIAEIADCVQNALELADEDEFEDLGLTSMLFPIMGTGTGRADIRTTAHKLIHAAVGHLKRHPPCRIDRVYFIALNEEQFGACQYVLDQADDLTIVQRG